MERFHSQSHKQDLQGKVGTVTVETECVGVERFHSQSHKQDLQGKVGTVTVETACVGVERFHSHKQDLQSNLRAMTVETQVCGCGDILLRQTAKQDPQGNLGTVTLTVETF